MVVFQRFLTSPESFYVSYQFDDFASSKRVALQRCADYVRYITEGHEVLSSQPFEYVSKDGYFQIIAEVVDDGKVEYYGIRKSILWGSV